VRNCQSSQKEKFYSYASYCWNGIFGTIAAIKGLFQGKTNIICEVENDFKLQERALALFQEMGMRIRYMDPKSHDKTFVLHSMLGKTVIDKENMSRIFLIWRVLVLKVSC
jgi:prephenate dehydrogenase